METDTGRIIAFQRCRAFSSRSVMRISRAMAYTICHISKNGSIRWRHGQPLRIAILKIILSRNILYQVKVQWTLRLKEAPALVNRRCWSSAGAWSTAQIE